MHKLSIARFGILTFMVFWTTGCSTLFTDCVEGSGELRTESRQLESFHSIVVKGSAEVIFTQGSDQQLRITADENILPIITTTVSDNTLTIDSKECYSQSQQLKVEVTVPNLTLFKIEGSGSFTNLPSSTNEELTLDALQIVIEGSGKVHLQDALIDALTIGIEGSGNVNAIGGGESIVIDVDGSGDVTADQFLVKDAEATISGSGNIRLQPAERLQATISGSGKIYYRGNPETVQTDISGSGKVIKLH